MSLKSFIHAIEIRYQYIIKLFSFLLLLRLIIYYFLYTELHFFSSAFFWVDIIIIIVAGVILLLVAYWIYLARSIYTFWVLMLALALIFNGFDGSDQIVLRLARQALILFNVSIIFFFAFTSQPKESLKAFYTFIYFSVVLFLLANALTDLKVFYGFSNFDSFTLWLRGKISLLYITSALFIYIEMGTNWVKNGINKIQLFFVLSIFTVYGSIFFYLFNHYPSIPMEHYSLDNPMTYGYVFQLFAYIMFFLYYFSKQEYFPTILFITVLLSISFHVDLPFNSFLILMGFVFIAVPAIKRG